MVGVVTLLRRGTADRIVDAVIMPVVVTAIFLFSFSRTTNVHHGGTPSLSRYALWLIPLAIPLLSCLERIGGRWWLRFLWSVALASALFSVIAFRPSVPQNSREPTWLATFLWTRLPAWNNPLPEVFIETQLRVDEMRVPVATSGCEKVLVAAGDANESAWPSPCYPAPLPVACQTAGSLCYANRTDRQYEFVPVRGAMVDAQALRRDAVWPASAVIQVRKLYDAWNWPSLRSGSLSRVSAEHVSFEFLGSNDRFILVLRDPRDGAVVRLRPTRAMRGVLIDAITGDTLRVLQYGAGENVISLDLPRESNILLLAMQEDEAR
jgi:hypothetical protein